MHHYADWRIQILFPKGLKKCALCSLFKIFYINVLISDNFFSVHSLSGVQDPKAAPRSRAWLPWQGEEGPGQGHCWPPGSSDRRYSIGELTDVGMLEPFDFVTGNSFSKEGVMELLVAWAGGGLVAASGACVQVESWNPDFWKIWSCPWLQNFLSRDETMNKRVLDDLPFIQLDNMFIAVTSQAWTLTARTYFDSFDACHFLQ